MGIDDVCENRAERKNNTVAKEINDKHNFLITLFIFFYGVKDSRNSLNFVVMSSIESLPPEILPRRYAAKIW